MKVSWLVPVRDEPRLDEALASIELEPGDEIVVVDDGSVEAVPGAHRIERSGLVPALEVGRGLCRNPLIARLDADDLAFPGRIAAQRRVLVENPRVAAVGGRARFAGSPGMAAYVDWVNTCDVMAERFVESTLFHPAVTFRAEAVEAVGGYRGALDGAPIPEDYDLWLRLAQGHLLARVDQDVVEIRDSETRLTRTHPAYTREAFHRCRVEHLLPLLGPRAVAVHGAGKRGRAWLRALGERVVELSDVKPGGHRGRHRVQALEQLRRFEVLLVAAPRAALPGLRARIERWRPDLVEGRDWFAVG